MNNDIETYSIDELRQALSKAAEAPNTDITLILAISSEIARRDINSARFSTDAGIIGRLGRELVAKQSTAVVEIIKNAYDADATWVTLSFSNISEPGGALLIQDNGLGMTRSQLTDGFMRLSSDAKLTEPISPRYHRQRAGKKGIGRFAVQRLGTELTITTQTLQDDFAIRVHIKWDDYKPGTDLWSVSHQIQTITPKERDEGTTLAITNLREKWTEAEQKRVFRYSSELFQPYQLTWTGKTNSSSKEVASKISKKKNESIIDPGFKVTLQNIVETTPTVIASQESSIFEHATAVINAYVDDKGEGIWSVQSKVLGIEEELQEIGPKREKTTPFIYLKNVHLKAYYFIWDRSLYPNLMFNTLWEVGRQQGGIRVFRNGFRVPPYGDRENDWLELDASYGTRRYLPPHGNSNFIGFVELVGHDNEGFEETSSREGLLEGDAYTELTDFAYRVLIAAMLRVAEARSKKRTASQSQWDIDDNAVELDMPPAQSAKEKVNTIRQLLNEAKKKQDKKESSGEHNHSSGKSDTAQDESNDSNGNTFKEADQNLDDLFHLISNSEEREAKLLEEMGMLRVLSSLGLVIGEFAHEVRQTLAASELSGDKLLNLFPESDPNRITVEHLLSNVNRFSSYTAYFDRTVANNSIRELAPQDLRIRLRRFVETMRPAAERKGVKIDALADGYEIFTVPMHSSEVNSLLLNLYSNAMKAIHRAGSEGVILIEVGHDKNSVYIEFSDNGDGIPEHIQERVFNAFFTTQTPGGRDTLAEDEIQGTGLGLKIVKDIIISYNGSIQLVSPPTGFSTCFRIELPKSKIESDEN